MTNQEPSPLQSDPRQVEQADWRPLVPLPPIPAAPHQHVLVPLFVYLSAAGGPAVIILLLLRYVTGSLW